MYGQDQLTVMMDQLEKGFLSSTRNKAQIPAAATVTADSTVLALVNTNV